MLRYLIIAGLCLFTHTVLAQFAGNTAFQFLNVPSNARLAALGGVNVSLADRDVNFTFSNPALVSDSLKGMASAGYTFYVADIGQAAFAYNHNFQKIGTLTFGVQHFTYGELAGYDATGAEIGSFNSGETAVIIGKSHQVNNFRIGVNLKGVFSSIAGFRSSAFMMDVGGLFKHPTKDLTIGLVFKNIGFVASEYSETSSTSVPFDVQAGVSFKPEHMPLRFSLAVYNLVEPGKAYDNPDDTEDNVSSINKVMQHLGVGTEILLHKNVNILLGYNFLRQQELKTQNGAGQGLTAGASVKVKALELVLSRSGYSVGNAAWAFTVSASIESMFLKNRI